MAPRSRPVFPNNTEKIVLFGRKIRKPLICMVNRATGEGLPP
jgi:hypothetical protein